MGNYPMVSANTFLWPQWLCQGWACKPIQDNGADMSSHNWSVVNQLSALTNNVMPLVKYSD